jgi:hypothetical protein
LRDHLFYFEYGGYPMLRYCRFIVLFLISTAACAVDRDAAQSWVAQDLVDCAAFYLLVGDLPGMETPGTTTDETQPSTDTQQVGLDAMQIATNYGNQRLLMVRLHLAMENMKRNLEENWQNVLTLRERNGANCPALMSAPEDRMAYYLSEREEETSAP